MDQKLQQKMIARLVEKQHEEETMAISSPHINMGTSGLESPPLAPAEPVKKSALSDLVTARLIPLLAVIGGVGMFSYATAFPDPWRTGTVIAYAIVVVLPTLWLYGRK